MALMTLPKGTENQPFLPAGTYGSNEPVRIQSAAIEPIVRDDNDGPKYLRIRVGVPSPAGLVFVSTQSRFRDHCSMEPNSGSKAKQFLRGLGFDDPDGKGFDLDGLPGTEVIVEVGYRTYMKDGETRHINWITNIARKG